MAVDLTRFLPQYFEESSQSLQEVVRSLRAISTSGWDASLADQASRAAHSIKGNSGAFGFDEIGSLASDLEHVLRKSAAGFGSENFAFVASCEAACTVLGGLLQARREGRVGDTNKAREQALGLLAWLQEGRGVVQQGGSGD